MSTPTKRLMTLWALVKGPSSPTMGLAGHPSPNLQRMFKILRKGNTWSSNGKTDVMPPGCWMVCILGVALSALAYNASQLAPFPILNTMSYALMLMSASTCVCTFGHVNLKGKISSNTRSPCNHSRSLHRADSLKVNLLATIASGPDGTWYGKDDANSLYSHHGSLSSKLSQHVKGSTGPGTDDPRILMMGSEVRPRLKDAPIYLMVSQQGKHRIPHTVASECKILSPLEPSSWWRRSGVSCFDLLVVCPADTEQMEGMANSGESATSSPDPLQELEAEVRVLRRRVRRQGNFMHQLDHQGGRRLDRVEDELVLIRSDFKAAFEALEEKVMVATDNLELRLQRAEAALANLRKAEIAGHDKYQEASKPAFGARHR